MPTFKAVNEELTRRLADALVAARVGATVSYPTLSRALGRDIQEHRYYLPRAMDIASAETGAVFRNVRGVGYERIEAAEAHGKGQAARRKTRKILRVSRRQIENALRHANDLTLQEIRKNHGEIVHCSVLEHQTYDRNAPITPPEPWPEDPAKIAAKSIDAMRQSLGRAK